MTRGVVSVLVQELIAQGVIYEGATGEAARAPQADLSSYQDSRSPGCCGRCSFTRPI